MAAPLFWCWVSYSRQLIGEKPGMSTGLREGVASLRSTLLATGGATSHVTGRRTAGIPFKQENF